MELKKWKKLVKMKKAPTRIISITIEDLKKAGFDPLKELEGTWEVHSKELLLKIREKKILNSKENNRQK